MAASRDLWGDKLNTWRTLQLQQCATCSIVTDDIISKDCIRWELEIWLLRLCSRWADIVLELAWSLLVLGRDREHVRIDQHGYGRKGKTNESTRERWLWKSVKELETQQHDVLLLKVMLVLHIARVLQHLESGSQNEGWGVHNAGNQIKVAYCMCHEQGIRTKTSAPRTF